MATPKKVVVSGGAGFIGRKLCAELRRRNLEVVVLDNLHPQVHGEAGRWPAALDGCETVLGDVGELQAWAQTGIDENTFVFHLAAETGTGQSLTQPKRHAEVNVVGLAALLEHLQGSGVRPAGVTLPSSRAVYGEGDWLDEEEAVRSGDQRRGTNLKKGQWTPYFGGRALIHPLPNRAQSVVAKPTNVYAATKLAQEHLLQTWSTAMEVPFSILRLQNVYGAGQAISNPYTGVLTHFAVNALSGRPINVYEGGGIVRDFVHVDDVVEALCATLGSPTSQAIDIGSGQPKTLLEIAELLHTFTGGGEIRVTSDYRLGDVRSAYADTTSAARCLDFRPRVDLDRGLRGLLAGIEAEIRANA